MTGGSIRRGGRTPKLVLFDLDDTLCDHDTSLRLRLAVSYRAALGDATDVDLAAVVGESIRRSIAGTEHFADVLRRFGVTDPVAVRHAVDTYVSDRYLGLELFAEALDVVAAISRHARVGLITNGPSKIQRDKIARLAIAEHFPIILVSEEEGVWKPDPLIFARALARAGVAPTDAVFVGDSPGHDIAGARAAGLTSVWVNRSGRSWPGGPPPNYEIRDLRELLSLFDFPAEPRP